MAKTFPLLVLAAALLGGCIASPYQQHRSQRYGGMRNKETLRPTVAVTDFENRANFSGQWNLGSGFADVLVTHLMDTEQVVVLERKHIENVIGEIRMQESPYFRAEGQVERGRLKNASYLIRGAITDFTVTGDVSGWFASTTAILKGGISKARVALHITISDVESGEIIDSLKTTGSASAGFFSGGIKYNSFAFGGDAYFRTPLGRATDEAMRKSIREILKRLPTQQWSGQVAQVDGQNVIINGGLNVGLTPGTRFEVRSFPRTITDPATGNVIEVIPGGMSGILKVEIVKNLSAHCTLMQGRAERGMILVRVE